MLLDATVFHTLKAVVDAEADEYVRVILDDQEYSLAGIAAQAVPNASAPAIGLTVRYEGLAAANNTAYIDDVILTQNEPA